MGMFDYVNVKLPCSTCGELITEFQSKDSDCELGNIHPCRVDCFYSSCDNIKCSNRGTWVQYNRTNHTDTEMSPEDHVNLYFEEK